MTCSQQKTKCLSSCGSDWQYINQPQKSTTNISVRANIYNLQGHPCHTRSFDQNSFQIDSMYSCITLKKLQFWLKIVWYIYLLMLKQMIGLYFENVKKNARWRHRSKILKRNLKTNISLLLFLLWGRLGRQKEQ